MCWAPSLAELSGHWLWGILFIMVAERRLWLVGRDDFGFCWRHSCMVGSMVKGICGSLVGTLNAELECWYEGWYDEDDCNGCCQ
jgi:hypothetical protein